MKRYSLVFLAAALLLVSVNFACSGGQKKQRDNAVFAEWVVNGWYHGSQGEACGNGFMIYFDDGDKKCCAATVIVKDIIPYPSSVTAGKKVLAEWTNGKYYPGTVSSISGDSYNINFDDGDKGTVRIDQIRLRN